MSMTVNGTTKKYVINLKVILLKQNSIEYIINKNNNADFKVKENDF